MPEQDILLSTPLQTSSGSLQDAQMKGTKELKRLFALIVLIFSGGALYEAISLDKAFDKLLPGAELTVGSVVARVALVIAGLVALSYLIMSMRRTD